MPLARLPLGRRKRGWIASHHEVADLWLQLPHEHVLAILVVRVRDKLGIELAPLQDKVFNGVLVGKVGSLVACHFVGCLDHVFILEYFYELAPESMFAEGLEAGSCHSHQPGLRP